jgi:hypothetical protein
MSLRYLPGYSHEQGKSTRFVQNVETQVTWTVKPNISIVPSFFYEETGTYYYNLSNVEFEIRF